MKIVNVGQNFIKIKLFFQNPEQYLFYITLTIYIKNIPYYDQF